MTTETKAKDPDKTKAQEEGGKTNPVPKDYTTSIKDTHSDGGCCGVCGG